jgi:hypothetical protein
MEEQRVMSEQVRQLDADLYRVELKKLAEAVSELTAVVESLVDQKSGWIEEGTMKARLVNARSLVSEVRRVLRAP